MKGKEIIKDSIIKKGEESNEERSDFNSPLIKKM